VRASLILEAVSKKEKIDVTPEEFNTGLASAAREMNVEESKLADFYAKNASRREDFEFRIRQDKTVKFLLDKAKIKSA
jgi:FKBP-type peptidyl-prolyl cis-trans isomerase (trigger factor)